MSLQGITRVRGGASASDERAVMSPAEAETETKDREVVLLIPTWECDEIVA